MSLIDRESKKYSWIEWIRNVNRHIESDKIPNVRVLNLAYRNVCVTCVMLVWFSKNSCYERPYTITGSIKLTGSKECPKSICIDRDNGTLKAVNMELISMVKCLKGKTITFIYGSESGGVVPMKRLTNVEGWPLV